MTFKKLQLKIFEYKKQGLTQEYIANMVGITASKLSRITTGKTKPSITDLVKFSKFFDCTIYDLITEE